MIHPFPTGRFSLREVSGDFLGQLADLIHVAGNQVPVHGQAVIQVVVTKSASVEVDADANAVVKHFITGAAGMRGATRIDSREALEAQMEEDGIEIDEVLYDSDAPDN